MLKKRWFTATALILMTAVGCSDSKKPSDANFKKAINSDLAKTGSACIDLPQGGRFPIAIRVATLNAEKDTVSKLAALERSGLVHSQDVTEVPKGVFSATFTPVKAELVRHFDLTDAGKKDYAQAVGFFAVGEHLCYGHRTVNEIIKWTEPASMLGATVSEVIFTYKVEVDRDWAKAPDIQAAFPEINSTLASAHKSQERAAVVLTNKGWEVSR
jgi:hypothetical protein